jgi:hypothetical protein
MMLWARNKQLLYCTVIDPSNNLENVGIYFGRLFCGEEQKELKTKSCKAINKTDILIKHLNNRHRLEDPIFFF